MMALMNIWWPIFKQDIKTATSRRIASLLLVKLEDPRWLRLRLLCTEAQVISRRSRSTFLLLSCSREQEVAPYGTANRTFTTPCAMSPHYIQPNWITLCVTLLLFQGQYTKVPQNAQVISRSMLRLDKKSFQNWTAWNLNCGHQNNAAKTL